MRWAAATWRPRKKYVHEQQEKVAGHCLALPAILACMEAEEVALLRLHGQEYEASCQRFWRLIPFPC
jgi:protein-S-isoprenylcysteine O-methyltransferase Ste14